MHATNTPAEFNNAVDAHTNAVMELGKKAYGQFLKMGTDAATMVFIMLRSQSQSEGLNASSAMADLQSALRENDLNEQIKSNKLAQEKLDKAAKKMAAMKKVGPLITALIAILTVVIAVATCGTGIGLALTLAAGTIGFIAGGAGGGAKKGNGFDMDSAMIGLSVGSLIVPVGAVISAISKGIITAIEKLGMAGVAKGLKGAGANAGTKVAANSAVSATTKATEAAVGALKSITEKGLKQMRLAAENAAEAAGKAGSGLAETGAKMVETLPPAVREAVKQLFSNAQKTLNYLKGLGGSLKDMPAQKTMSILENTMYFAQASLGQVQASMNFAVALKNNEAQVALLDGQRFGLAAKVAQDEYKGTQDFLSAMQEFHGRAMKQIKDMLTSHHQILMKAISYIGA